MNTVIKTLLLAGVLLFGALPAFAGCNPQLEVCDFPSRTEIQKRAALVPEVITQRRVLGTQWSATHERFIARYTRIAYSCVEKVLVSPRGNFNAALCMPQWMRRVPPGATLTFARIETNTKTVLYLISMEDIYRYNRYRYRW